MMVRTFCCQSVFSWSLSHSVWQRVKHFSFTFLLLIIFWSDCFINVLFSGSPPGYFENHSMCSAHKSHRSHLLYVYAYFLGVGNMGRILIQSPGSFRFCRHAQAWSLWEATRNNKCEYVLGPVGRFIIALLTTMAWIHYLLITKCCTPNSFFFFFQTQALEQSAEEIGKTATSGRFLDPNENPKSIVQSLREVRGVIARKPCLGQGMCLLPSITQGKANFCITHKPFFSALSCVHCSVANFFVSLHTLHPVFVLHACNFRCCSCCLCV